MKDGDYDSPWISHPEIWATKSKFFTWLRGGIRLAIWNKYPPKLSFKNKVCKPPPEGLETRAKTGTECALTGEWTGKSKTEVDHIIGNSSLRDWDDVLPFIQHLCTDHSNMQLVSKEAHKIKSYAERMGITFEEAVIEKQVISFMKQSATQQKEFLLEEGCYDYDIINAKQRKAEYRGYLRQVKYKENIKNGEVE
jgi:hypothetical protein